jgi:hypothetical protein
LIRLFGDVSQAPLSRFRILVGVVISNVAAAGLCPAFAFAFFGIGFAAEEANTSIPIAVTLVLRSIALAVVALGTAVGAALKSFPWTAVLLTPLLVGVMTKLLLGDVAWWLGSCTSAAFLAGALAGRGLKSQARKNGRRQQRQQFFRNALKLSTQAPLSPGPFPSAEEDIREDRAR